MRIILHFKDEAEMIEADIHKLNDQEPRRPLNRLEADIWLGVEARLEARRTSRAVLSCQAAVLVIALMGSIVISDRTAVADGDSAGLGVFSIRSDLAPSTRLLGH
jgi:hypothetical protein